METSSRFGRRAATRQLAAGIIVTFALCGTLSAQNRGHEDDEDRGPNQPTIISAVVSVDQTTLFIEGDSFGRSPDVRLAGLRLGGVQVDRMGHHIIAVMPALPPGTYLLEVANRHKAANFDLTVGAVGPKGDKGDRGLDGAAGPAGAKGDKGDPGIPGNLALAGKSCPSGQFLTGFDASGGLVCAPANPPCTLVGTQATLNVASAIGLGGTVTALVQAGSAEFDPAPGDQRFSVDVEKSSIRMFNNTGNTNVLFNNATSYTVSLPPSVTVTGVTVTVNGVTGFAAGNVSFTAHSVTLDVTGSVWHGSDSVVVALQQSCGPACGLSNAQASLNVASAIGLGGSATASVHDGSVEFDPAPGDQRFSVDVEETSIRMFNNTGTTNVLFNNATSYTVSIPAAAGVSIVGVSTVVNGVSGFTAGNVSFTASSVTLAVTGSVWHGSDSVVVSLQTVCQ